MNQLGKSSALLRWRQAVFYAELGVQIAQVGAQRIVIEVDAVLGKLLEDCVVRSRNNESPPPFQVRKTERCQDRKVGLRDADYWS